MARCQDCDYEASGKCSVCHGTGQVDLLEQALDSVNPFANEPTPCWRCHGTGQCQTCDGTGEPLSMARDASSLEAIRAQKDLSDAQERANRSRLELTQADVQGQAMRHNSTSKPNN